MSDGGHDYGCQDEELKGGKSNRNRMQAGIKCRSFQKTARRDINSTEDVEASDKLRQTTTWGVCILQLSKIYFLLIAFRNTAWQPLSTGT